MSDTSVEPNQPPADGVDTSATVELEALPDWTQEQQIAHMLELCEAQMESALAESDIAIDTLTRAFSGLDDTVRSIQELKGDLHAALGQTQAGEIEQRLVAIRKQMANAVVAFQFYDKLTQRLGHVRYSLSTLATFVCDRAQASQRDQWRRLFRTLRAQYRTEEERQIFKMIVEGASAEEAREHVHQMTITPRAAVGGDIELF